MIVKTKAGKLAQAGPYELLGKIGDGGMATVYKGRHAATGRLVAVKVLSEQAAASAVVRARFQQEYRAACNLSHPHIVQGLDFGTVGDVPFLVMELVEGEDLATRVERGGKMPEAEAVPLIAQVGAALQLAHDHALVHRDVKPANILITHDGRAKLADLGLVKDYQSSLELTRPATGMGTPHYMAPEQFEDARHATPRCDLYSLAGTLYTALTGTLPFHAKTHLAILKKKMKNELTPPRDLAPGLSRHADLAVRRAMRADPEQRQASCREFIDALLERPVAAPAPARAEAEASRRPAARVPTPLQVERRATVRFPSAAEAACWPVAEAVKASWTARVQDISGSGVRLRLNRRYEPGALLALELLTKGKRRRSFFLVRVKRVTKESPKAWCIGCTFERQLLDFEVQDWL
jgi:serine/threonine protein kinase